MTEQSGGADHLPTFLVTGATSGVGEAIAAELAERRARVLVGARTAERGRLQQSEFRAAYRRLISRSWPVTFR